MPHHVRLRMAVQEQQWRPSAAVPHANRYLAQVDVLECEAGEEVVGHTAHSL